MKGALFIGFQRKLLLVAGAGGGNGNEEEALKKMADGMKSVQEDFRDSEGWGGWLSKELAPAFGVSGLARGHRRNKLIGAVPDLLGIFAPVHSRLVLSSLGASICMRERVSLRLKTHHLNPSAEASSHTGPRCCHFEIRDEAPFQAQH